MNVNLCQYRARVGGYYNTAFKLSLNLLDTKDMGNLLTFFILLNGGVNCLPFALLFHFYIYLFDIPLTSSASDYPSTTCNTYKLPHNYPNLPVIKIVFITILLILISGDIHPNPGPTASDLSIVHNNICSIEHKTIFVEAVLNKFDIITLSETWLHEGIANESILLHGYQPPIRRDRHGHGGVAIYVKEHLVCIPRPDLEVTNLEAVWIETKINQESILVGSFYRPPSARVGYWDLVDESISKVSAPSPGRSKLIV